MADILPEVHMAKVNDVVRCLIIIQAMYSAEVLTLDGVAYRVTDISHSMELNDWERQAYAGYPKGTYVDAILITLTKTTGEPTMGTLPKEAFGLPVFYRVR